MINLWHKENLVDQQDQVVPRVAACIPDSRIDDLHLSGGLRRVKTTDHNYFRMLINYQGILAYYTSVSI
jgi:hypothetical protein